MTNPAARKPSARAETPLYRSPTTDKLLVVYTSQSVDGTSFELDPGSQRRLGAAFPDVKVSTRHIYIAHDTREQLSVTISRFDQQIISLLTGLSGDRLRKKHFIVSFRDPRSEREIAQLSQPAKVA